MRILCTGAGGFISGHLINRLLADGHEVRAVDIKPFPEWWQLHDGAENKVLDLREKLGTYIAFLDGSIFDRVYHLAADMGGMYRIVNFNAEIIRNNTLININMIERARICNVGRFLFSSSACVYPVEKQNYSYIPCPSGMTGRILPTSSLKESDVYPASPQHSYGWEKLHAEHLCKYYQEAGWLETRVARFHNCYGPEGSWNDGREKAPAALCRKVAEAVMRMAKGCGCKNEIEIWGDGTAVRSFMHVDDCVEGLIRLMESDHHEPLNIGRDRAIRVDELADVIIEIANMKGKLVKRFVEGPVGVQWRNSDNTLCKEILGWEPCLPIETGLRDTYNWILEEVRQARIVEAFCCD